jgi:predicted alpha/beta-fold hydrolase
MMIDWQDRSAQFRQRPPWLGADLQTLRNFLLGPAQDLPGGETLLLPLRDGDRLAARLDRPVGGGSKPLIVLVHGLTGSQHSETVVAATRHFVAQGWPVLRLNLCGATPSRPTARGFYHAGKTRDLDDALQALPDALKTDGIILVGHSLGGNLVLKFMGEGGRDAPALAAVAVSPPLDLAATCRQMMTPRNYLYHRHILDGLKTEALAPNAELSAREKAKIEAARSIYDFDDGFVAPRFGYRDASDYYAQNASGRFLPAIRLPTLIVHAKDDPWIPASCYRDVDWGDAPAITPLLTDKGGHLGFHDVASATPWHDRMIVDWLTAQGL